MDMNFLSALSTEQLMNLKSVVIDEELRKKFFHEVERIITKRDERYKDISIFNVEDIPYFDEKLEDKCLTILGEISLERFYFLTRSFDDKGNGSRLSACRDVLDYIADCFGITVSEIIMGFQNPDIGGFNMYLSSFEKFFEEESLRKKFSNSFNIYNYIKSYIYQCLNNDKESTSKTVFKDYGLKQLVVERDLRKVASYLYQIRGTGDRRCSIANAGLSRTAQKVGTQITFNQRRLIEAVAFGTTLDKLNDENYEDSKKLIYVP